MECRVPAKWEVREIIEMGNSLKNKAMLAVLICTGMGTTNITKLRHQDIKDMDRCNTPMVLTEDKKAKYYTFLSENATMYLKRYEKYKRYKQSYILLEDPVFNSDFQGFQKQQRPSKQMSYENVENVIDTAVAMARLEGGERINPRSLEHYYKGVIMGQNADGEFLQKDEQQFLVGKYTGDAKNFFTNEKIAELRTAYGKFDFF